MDKKTKKYSADMYKYDDGIDPKDLLDEKEKPLKKLLHEWTDVFSRKR